MRIHLFILLVQLINFQIFAQTIENCAEFDTNTKTCSKCEDKYFPFFHNLLCLPCDDKNYGQIGCGGNCDSSRYDNDRFVYCAENECKEGFYYLEGLCLRCDEESPGCKKCYNTITQIGDQTDYKFTCQECMSPEYKMDEFGTCKKCKIDNCDQCIYSDDYSRQECLKCSSYYYLNSEKTCTICKTHYFDNGHCEVCSDNELDLEKSTCHCDSGYFLTQDRSCSFCVEGCEKCVRAENGGYYCFYCSSGRVLNNNQCISCPENCDSCIIDPDDNTQTKCTSCKYRYLLLNGQCEYCGDGCTKCEFDQNNQIVCLECGYDYYTLNSEKTCTHCPSIGSLGVGCAKCQYNEIKKDYECLGCISYSNSYSYIKNKFQCLSNTDSSQMYLQGCLEANFIEDDKYECLKCRQYYIYITDEKICKDYYNINLSSYCLEARNIGTQLAPTYTCTKCSGDTIFFTNSNGISDCVDPENNLAYCTEGKEDENTGNAICTKCVPSAHLNEESFCECDHDSFGKRNLFCYKCDDENYGSLGCEANEGCEYRTENWQLNCNKCKSNYFEFTNGQCYACSEEWEFCNKCHLDDEDQIVCDECIDNLVYNKYEKRCELNCQEYPDVAPGCIICNEEYKSKRKCQACKPGYFKTDDESCVFCRGEKYGGPACDNCIKDEKDSSIICENCEGYDLVMNSKGKCYFSPEGLMDNCANYRFKKIGDEEKFVCAFCKDGYYLDTNGNCVYFLQYLDLTENCYHITYHIGEIFISYYSPTDLNFYVYENEFYISSSNAYRFNETYLEFINKNLRMINHKITGECSSCQSNFLLNSEKKCVPIQIEDCSIISMIKNNIWYNCQIFCEDNQFTLILLNINKENNEPSYITISEIYDKILDSELFLSDLGSLINQPLCIDNSGNNGNNNLNNCLVAKFLEQENNYVCQICKQGFFLNKKTLQCIPYDDEFKCEYENIGTETNPIYSCKKCLPNSYFSYYQYFTNYEFDFSSDYENDYVSNYIMVQEGNINFCVPYSDKEKFLSATVDTTYTINKYNCTSCSMNYVPYYSNYYERYICQSVFEEIKKSQNNNYNNYWRDSGIKAINGKCQDNTFFTPDGENCYRCDNYYYYDKNGYYTNSRCKSQCSFSLEKDYLIKCLDGCVEGSIEVAEGICKSCSDINYGCQKCHYGDYPTDYLGVKRKRKFICDKCNSDSILQGDRCIICNQFENGCDECEIINNEFKCKRCYYNYVLDEEGHCNYCEGGVVYENICFICNDKNRGGIEGCLNCYVSENKTYCSSCQEGYALLKDNKTCLKISESSQLIKYKKCREFTLLNNKLYCLECKNEGYSLLKGDDESVCIYLPELNNYYYYNPYYYTNNLDFDQIFKYYYDRYISNHFDYCKEVINLGTEDNPLYSCNVCLYDSIYNLYTEENSNISYCIYGSLVNNKEVNNCKEKKIKLVGNTIKFTCISCYEENQIPVYHEIDKVNYCMEANETKCMAKNCKMCKPDDIYFCEICENENYAVNEVTGSCEAKKETPSSSSTPAPAIIWKDIFRLEMNSEKEVDGKTIKGPKLNLRGETSSEINSRHSFIIYLIFKLKQPLNLRNLQEGEDTIRIKAICEIENGVEANKDDTSIVDYECIGDAEDIDLSEFTLDSIDVGDDDSSNLKELVSTKNLLEIDQGPTIEFKMNKLENQTSSDYNFNITLNGRIDDNNLANIEIKEKFEMNEINTPSDCSFKIGEKRNASLNCILNIKDYQNIKVFSFKTTKIEHNKEYNISFLNLNKVYLLNEPIINEETATNEESDSDSDKKKISIGAIIGIVAGVVGAIALAVVITFCCLKKKNKNQTYETVIKFQPSS